MVARVAEGFPTAKNMVARVAEAFPTAKNMISGGGFYYILKSVFCGL